MKIFSHPPATPFEQFAVLDASSESAFGTGGQKSVDKVIQRLKIEAAKLGANGVILEVTKRPITAMPFTFSLRVIS